MQNPTGNDAHGKNVPAAKSGRSEPLPYEGGQGIDPATLTPEQADGTACVRCGRDFTTYAGAAVPVGIVEGGQLFACVSCTQPSPVAPTSAIWPAGEPETVRRAAEWSQICDQIREVTELVIRLITARDGERTGQLLVDLVAAILARRVDVDDVPALIVALNGGDLVQVEQAVSL